MRAIKALVAGVILGTIVAVAPEGLLRAWYSVSYQLNGMTGYGDWAFHALLPIATAAIALIFYVRSKSD